MPFSRRSSWDVAANALAARVDALRRAGAPLLDLSETNPTSCGLAWPEDELAAALAGPGVGRYRPDPRGAAAARAAVASYLAARGAEVDPAHVLVTASTSEGYALLLELLCDPGDEVLVPAPSYPLLDVLCQLESVRLVRYPLRYDGTWHVDLPGLAARVTERTRAVVVVSPSNPTGAVCSRDELDALSTLCAGRGLALVGDEVFADTAEAGAVSVASTRRCLAFHLSGLSKVCGLPQVKLAWIAVSGPARAVSGALERLDMIADAYLSVSGPAQAAAPVLLARRERFLRPLRERLATNEAVLAQAARGAPFDLLRRRGGWSAVLRIGETLDEERVCLELLEDGVVVQPGFFYDFERGGYLVVSLLPAIEVFAGGVEILARRLGRATVTGP